MALPGYGRARWPTTGPGRATGALAGAGVGGGECGIRTHGEPKPTTAFEAAPFVRSGNSPSATLAAVRAGRANGQTAADAGSPTQRRSAKKSVSRAAHSSARTSAVVSNSWFSRGSEPRW